MATSDLETSVGTLQKILESFRSLPFWLLATLAVVAFILWKVPGIPVPVPPRLNEWLPATALTAGVGALLKLASDITSIAVARRRLMLMKAKARLDNLYHPMAALLLTCYVTSATNPGPSFRDRVAKARAALIGRRRLNVALAWHLLWERKESTYAEVEFGSDFPHSQIMAALRNHIAIADRDLQYAVRRADRARYEDSGSDYLTSEELALYNHIHDERERLVRRTRWLQSGNIKPGA